MRVKKKRTVPNAEESIMETLRWAGLQWDEGEFPSPSPSQPPPLTLLIQARKLAANTAPTDKYSTPTQSNRP